MFFFFSFSNDKDNFATTANTSKGTKKDDPSKNFEKPVQQHAVPIVTPKLPKTLPRSKTMPRLSVTSPKQRPRKSVSKVKRLEFNSSNQSKITDFFGGLQGPKK